VVVRNNVKRLMYIVKRLVHGTKMQHFGAF